MNLVYEKEERNMVHVTGRKQIPVQERLMKGIQARMMNLDGYVNHVVIKRFSLPVQRRETPSLKPYRK